MLPHLGVHRRGEHDRAARGEQGVGEQVVGQPVRGLGHQVGGRRGHHDQVGVLADPDVRHLVDVAPHLGGDRLAGQRRPGRGADELERGRGRHDGDVVAGLGEPAQQLAGLVRRDPAGHAEDDTRPPPARETATSSLLVMPASLSELGHSDAAERRLEGSSLGGGLLGGELGGVDVLAGQQVLVDLAQRDRERLLLDVGVDQRADVLQQALAELGVVGVDLAGALGAVEDQLVLESVLVSRSSIEGLVIPSAAMLGADTREASLGQIGGKVRAGRERAEDAPLPPSSRLPTARLQRELRG